MVLHVLHIHLTLSRAGVRLWNYFILISKCHNDTRILILNFFVYYVCEIQFFFYFKTNLFLNSGVSHWFQHSRNRSAFLLKVASTPENIKKIPHIDLDGRKVNVRDIIDTVNISTECERNILHGRSHIKNFLQAACLKDQKQQHVEDSERNLAIFKRNLNELLFQFVTMDETLIHHYTPKSNRQWAEWL